MPTAICTTCQHLQYWKKRKGARLADLRCNDCGAPLTAAVEMGCPKCRVVFYVKASTRTNPVYCPNCRFRIWY